MGWKNVKEFYRIGHLVQVVPDKGICIGSPYIHDIIVIGFDGLFRRRLQPCRNDDLCRYQEEMDEDPGKLKDLIETPDIFENSVTIWTYKGGDIIEKQCEIPEWPNVTHDGQMIYENTHSTDRSEVVEWAKQNAEAYLIMATEQAEEARKRLTECQQMFAEAKGHIKKLSVA